MNEFRPPDALIFSGNLSENWRRWSQRFDLYLKASGKDKKDEKIQVAILLHVIGEEGLEIFNNFVWAEESDKDKIANVLKMFKDYCMPRKNTLIERYLFWERKQTEGESLDQFVNDLKTRAKNCEYNDQTNYMIRDRIIFGIHDERLRERLLRESDNPTLEKVVDMCRAAEASKKQLKTIKGEAQVDAITKKPHIKDRFPATQTKQKRFTPPASSRPMQKFTKEKTFDCNKCGNNHKPNSCPAYGKQCRLCKKPNHFAKQCFTKKRIHEVEHCDEESDSSDNQLYIGEVKVHTVESQNQSKGDNAWYSLVKIEDKTVKFKLDTGAETNVIPKSLFSKLRNAKLQQTRVNLTTYGNKIVKPMGKLKLNLKTQNNSQSSDAEFYVVDFNATPILGLKTCSQMNLLKKVETVGKRNDNVTMKTLLAEKEVFNGLGKFEGQYHIELDPTVKPVVNPPRKVPHTIMPKLKKALEKLEESGVIVAVEEATDWVNSLVVVEKKNGNLRLCLDPRDLNKAIKRQHFKIPTVQEIASQLNGKSLFSILDEKDGYHQVELDTESSYLCTFQTPFGRYRYTRMPFGISSASEVFQRKNMQTFGDIPGVHMIADDMIIAGKDEMEHDETLKKVMKRAKDKNIKFNKDKIQLKVREVKYMGNIISADGMKPDPEKIKAIQKMPVPTDKAGIQRLLGTINFLAQYIPNMSEITAPLRMLLKENVQFAWQHEQDEALEKIKTALTANPVLSYYDVTKDVTIQTDASQSGIGSCLLQNGHVIAYASRSMTDAEKNYAQIEKELLAVLFACEKFNQYIYGKKVSVQTDHKPLEAIKSKPLHKAPPRLQRMLLRLQKYDLDLKYIPGKFMYVADTLSRAFVDEDNAKQEYNEEMDIMIHTIVQNLPISDEKLSVMRNATMRDPELLSLKSVLKEGWPQHKKNLPENLRPYWNYMSEIHEADNLLFVGDRIIVPLEQRNYVLSKIHESHLGIEKCKSRAKQSLYWPNMFADIEMVCSQCSVCNKYKRQNQKETLIQHEVPARPWQKVGIDNFEYKSRNYVLVVDYYSKFVEIRLLQSTSAQSVVNNLKAIFSVHGIPEEIVSDNMPFNSTFFKTFAKEYNIKLSTSSPTHSQSNGMSERSIQTVKQLFRKAHEEGKDEYIAMLEYRNTPVTGMKYSPAQLLMGRMLRDIIPTNPKLFEPKLPENAKIMLKQRQQKQKMYYDKSAKDMKPLEPGDSVRYRHGKTWEPAVVVNKHDSPRSYIISTENGQSLRRNRKHIMKTKEETIPIVTEDEFVLPENKTEQYEQSENRADQSAASPRPKRTIVKPMRYRDSNFVE